MKGVLLSIAVAAAACSPMVRPCDEKTCAGCCDGPGVCRESALTTCGVGGKRCVACQLTQTCVLGTCIGQSSSGGGSGNGGGFATGGGTGGGGGGGFATGGGVGGGGGGVGGGVGGGTATGKPNLMVMFDKSGSMQTPIPGGVGCNGCAFPTCPEATCPTRMGQVRAAMGNFLTTHGAIARVGLTIFPADNTCGPATAMEQLLHITPPTDSDADCRAWASQANNYVQMLTPVGGTPTGASLGFLLSVPELNTTARRDFVLLVTDGLPNCNGTNTNTCLNPTACKCTISSCGTMINDTDPNNFCRKGCLDQAGAVGAVTELRARSITTIVVGFGADFSVSSDGFNVLNGMGSAGGWSRRCPVGNECGTGNTCLPSTHTCVQSFYTAQSALELIAALDDIARTLPTAP